MVDIRLAESIEDYRAVGQLQKAVWQMADAQMTPYNLLNIIHKSGGLVLLAFPHDVNQDDPQQAIGFVFSFIGLTAGGSVKHCSHQAGVLPEYQNQGIGYRLKLAQRDHVLAQGIHLITWTFDPLESRNAYLNMHKLGTICHTYLVNIYGVVHDALNEGLPSDRFEAEWHIASERVAGRIEPATHTLQPTRPDHADITVINPAIPGDLLRPSETWHPIAERTIRERPPDLLVQIPANFQDIKATDMGLAQAWREHTRHVFMMFFSAGYQATDLFYRNQQCYYLLEDENRTN